LDEKTGIVDMRMHPSDPNTLIVAAWERLRDLYDEHDGGGLPEGIDSYDPIVKWGPKAGLYKTTDGGKNWKRLEKGLPTSNFGRVGLDWNYRKNPNVVFAIIDCADIGKGPSRDVVLASAVGIQLAETPVARGMEMTSITPQSPAATAGLRNGDIL